MIILIQQTLSSSTYTYTYILHDMTSMCMYMYTHIMNVRCTVYSHVIHLKVANGLVQSMKGNTFIQLKEWRWRTREGEREKKREREREEEEKFRM